MGLETLGDYLSERSTRKTKIKDFSLPATPNGDQVYEHKIGDWVTATDKGSIKEGYLFQITDCHKSNGFVRYYGAGMWHRKQDITAC